MATIRKGGRKKVALTEVIERTNKETSASISKSGGSESIRARLMRNFVGCLPIKGHIKTSPRDILEEECRK